MLARANSVLLLTHQGRVLLPSTSKYWSKGNMGDAPHGSQPFNALFQVPVALERRSLTR